MARAANIAPEVANCLMAVEETITTPTPGLGHGKLADIIACITYALGTLHIV